MVAVVSQKLAVSDAGSLRQFSAAGKEPLRVASEYTHIADEYAREHHLGHYRIVPTWGATEAFLPEDADLLIENTETGGTIARHNLRIIDTLFESTACLVGAADNNLSPVKKKKIEQIIRTFRAALEEA